MFEYLAAMAISGIAAAALSTRIQKARNEKDMAYLRARLDAKIDALVQSRAEQNELIAGLEAKIHELESTKQYMQDEIVRREAACADARSGLETAVAGKAELQRQAGKIALEAARLKGMAATFERWHDEMTSLMAQNQDMHSKNEELTAIVKHVVIVSLNASIEAARAGTAGRGFSVVAGEVRELALRSEQLSKNYSDSLHKSDLTTTATFQDIQAGGKMMLASLAGIESLASQFQSRLKEAA